MPLPIIRRYMTGGSYAHLPHEPGTVEELTRRRQSLDRQSGGLRDRRPRRSNSRGFIGFARLWEDKAAPETSLTIADLLAVGESQTVEFKSTARLNLHTGQVDKKMEHVITKTVCGFLNAEGGTLLIGVDDFGKVLGLEADMQTLGAKGNQDGYELFLRQHLDNNLSIQTAGVVRIRFEEVEGEAVCAVTVAASGKQVFARPPEAGLGVDRVLGSNWQRNESSCTATT